MDNVSNASNTCPKCGAERSPGRGDLLYRCGTSPNGGGSFTEGYVCLRNQLAHQTARAIKYMKAVEQHDLDWSEKLRVVNDRLAKAEAETFDAMAGRREALGILSDNLIEVQGKWQLAVTRAEKAEAKCDRLTARGFQDLHHENTHLRGLLGAVAHWEKNSCEVTYGLRLILSRLDQKEGGG